MADELTAQDFKTYILEMVADSLELWGITDPDDDFDLIESGAVDSMAFLDLIVGIETHFGLQVDFEELDPENLGQLGSLCKFLEKMAAT
ncbi:MAG: phosphopantetheine-binding protein [Acidimicrobiales bacterium]